MSSELLYITLLSRGLTAPNQTSQYQDLANHISERVDNPSQSHSRPSTPVDKPDIPLLDFESSSAAKLSSPGLPRPASPYVILDIDLPSKASSFDTPHIWTLKRTMTEWMITALISGLIQCATQCVQSRHSCVFAADLS